LAYLEISGGLGLPHLGGGLGDSPKGTVGKENSYSRWCRHPSMGFQVLT